MPEILGTPGNDDLAGTAEDLTASAFTIDTIRGLAGNDTIRIGLGPDLMYGDEGDDQFLVSTVVSTSRVLPRGLIDGGAGFDVIDASNSSPSGLFFSSGSLIFRSGSQEFVVLNVEEVRLGGLVSVTLGSLASALTVRTGNLNDGLTASSATRSDLYGGGGADTLRGEYDDFLFGESGDDRFFVSGNTPTGALQGRIDGGTGTDLLQLNIGGVLDLTSGTLRNSLFAGTATVTGIENVELLVAFGYAASAIGDDGANEIYASSSLGTAGSVTIDGRGGNDILRGLSANDVLLGGSGNDQLFGNAGDDRLEGGEGNDQITGGDGRDTIVGGAGFDVALYAGLRRAETPDVLSGIEEARFVDGVLTFDASSASAQVMRLYSATLNRVPDQGGLEANTGALASLGLQGLANTFVASAEFQARFGALNNQQFVEQLYQFALGRAGDAPGIASWVALLNGGASRGQVVVGFSESAENVARTAATLNAGLWVPDQQALIIARLYDATFKRLPDVGGLTGWVNALKSGTSVTDIAAAFAGSAEFQATFGALSNQAFVEQLYRFCLNREGDPGGIAGWVNALNTGTSRASVLLGFSESAEHVALTANLWLGGIRYAGFVGAATEDAAKDMDAPLVLPDVEVIELEHDPADLGLSILDKDADAFVLPALEDLPLPTVDPANPFDGLDLAALRATALNDGRMMLILPETPEATPDFDLDAWTPAQRDGHWLM